MLPLERKPWNVNSGETIPWNVSSVDPVSSNTVQTGEAGYEVWRLEVGRGLDSREKEIA